MISSKVSFLEEKNRWKSIKNSLKTIVVVRIFVSRTSFLLFVALIYADILGLVQDAGLDEEDYSHSDELNNSKGSAAISQSSQKPSSASHMTV